jgi:putative hydroxymethylpyrimidine transport system ATP-binding protein
MRDGFTFREPEEYSVLEVSDLRKIFGNLTVFDGFSLTVPRGGFTALVGPSGCGKSTLFDVLTGVVAKDNGEISWLGENVCHLGKKAAYMQQKDLLLPWLSLLDNALLPTRISGRNEGSRALDAITRKSLQSHLLLLQSEFEKTILMITHDVEEALLLADEVVVLTPFPMDVRERIELDSSKPRKGSQQGLLEIKEHVLEELQGEL